MRGLIFVDMGFGFPKRGPNFFARKWVMKMDPLAKKTPFPPAIPFKLGNAILMIFGKNVVEDVMVTKKGDHALIILKVKHVVQMLLITLKLPSLALAGMARQELHVEVSITLNIYAIISILEKRLFIYIYIMHHRYYSRYPSYLQDERWTFPKQLLRIPISKCRK